MSWKRFIGAWRRLVTIWVKRVWMDVMVMWEIIYSRRVFIIIDVRDIKMYLINICDDDDDWDDDDN
jgi:hypothetical protein